MATVSAPLMSLDASGTIAGAIVFSKWKGRNYVRRHAIPANPQSGLQVSMRSMMRFLSQSWTLTPVDPTTWLAGGESLRISPFNYFIRENMIRWRQYRGPSTEYPAAQDGTPPSAPTTTPTGGVHSIQLSIADGGTPPDFAWIIHRSPTTGFIPSLSNVVAVIVPTATPTIYIDHPLVAGSYYYRIRGAEVTGNVGALEAEVTAAAS